MAGMEERDEKRGGWGFAIGLILLVLALLTLYVLSSGPATWLNMHGYISAETVKTIYDPLSWACLHCKPLQEAIAWYIDRFWT